jgi:hypothetical protein
MSAIVTLLFGASWKTSLLGMGSAAIAAAALYAAGQTEPGFYLLALGLGALGRFVADAQAPKPPPE